MNYKLRLDPEKYDPIYRSSNGMTVGDLAEIAKEGDNGGCGGHILLRIYAGFVSLTSPNHTWPDDADLPIISLKRGQSVVLTVNF